MCILDSKLTMEDIGFFKYMEEQEAKQQQVNVEQNVDFVGIKPTTNDEED